MNLLRLNWNVFIYFYNSYLRETPLITHQKTIVVPRYSHDTGFHQVCVTEMFFEDKFVKHFNFLLQFF